MLLGENSESIHGLFTVDAQYQVPRYQRRYVWNETNWETLWEDILSQLDLELEPEDRGHFTGLIVTRPISRNLYRYEVIDGQQRLTTFQIILCVIRDICQLQDSAELAELADEVGELIVNSNTVIRRNVPEPFPDPTYKFRPTDYDRSAFEAIAEGQYGKVIPQAFDKAENRLQSESVKKVRSQVFAEPEKVSPIILDAYDYFYEQIRVYVGETCDYKKIDGLISSIKFDFNLVHITFGSSDQPEKIFESLNATGRKLSEFDYLRNNLFLRAAKLGEDENGNSYSDIYYDKYWHFENDSHYWNADRLDSFFRAFLTAELGPEREGKTLKAFDRYRNYSKTLTKNQRQSIKYELQQLRHYADSYKEMHNSALDLGSRMQFYNDLNLPSLDSFILFLKHRLERDISELLDVCNILESYLVWRLLCPDGEDSYIRINVLFSEAIKVSEFHVRQFAEDLYGMWPNSEEVRKALEQAWSKDHNLILYILYRIELLKRGRPQSSDFKSLKVPERIECRGLTDYSVVDSIGNITPLTSTAPDQWHLLPFTEKKIFLEDEIANGLILTQEICTCDTWNTEEIYCRANELISSFYAIWPPVHSFI